MPKNAHKPTADMPLLQHLQEARKRILWALAGILLGAIVGWVLAEPIISEMTAPLKGQNPLIFQLLNRQLPHENKLEHIALNFTTVTGAFNLKFKIALWAGFIISSPWWILQIWLYIAPALYKKEKIYLLTFGCATLFLFWLGVIIGMYITPQAVSILNEFTPAGASSFITANSYFNFYMTLILTFGITTLIPELLVALNFLSILSVKQMLRGWRIATITAYTFAAITNPVPNPTSMIIQGTLMCALYFLAIGICAIRERITKRNLH